MGDWISMYAHSLSSEALGAFCKRQKQFVVVGKVVISLRSILWLCLHARYI